MSLAHEVMLLNVPIGRRQGLVVVAELPLVLQDAAYLRAGQGEDHLINLESGSLALDQIRRLHIQRDDRAVGMDGAGPPVGYGVASLRIWHLNRRQFFALFSKYFDTRKETVIVKVVVNR